MKRVSAFWTRFSDLLLETVYPTRCALCGRWSDVLCVACRDEMILNPVDVEPRGDLAFSVPIFAYSGRAARAVQRLKFDRITGLADPMSLAVRAWGEAYGCLRDTVVMPVPIHWTRRFERGFNQAELLARHLPGTHDQEALARVQATRPQAGLPVKERRRDLQNAFLVRKDVRGMSIVLIDDVVTTGHTAQACAAVLKAAGALEVGILAFAGNP